LNSPPPHSPPLPPFSPAFPRPGAVLNFPPLVTRYFSPSFSFPLRGGLSLLHALLWSFPTFVRLFQFILPSGPLLPDVSLKTPPTPLLSGAVLAGLPPLFWNSLMSIIFALAVFAFFTIPATVVRCSHAALDFPPCFGNVSSFFPSYLETPSWEILTDLCVNVRLYTPPPPPPPLPSPCFYEMAQAPHFCRTMLPHIPLAGFRFTPLILFAKAQPALRCF